jgi:hypothetical protein
MNRALIAVMLLAASITAVHAFGLGRLGTGFGMLGSSGHGGHVAPPATGALLLEDGSSFLLLEDGSSHLCLEGGC